MSNPDRDKMRDYYDRLGEREWERLEATVNGRVSFVVHQHFLSRFIEPGQHVLEIGAGPGRFTFELAKLGARVDVTDISPVQLALHEVHLAGSDAEAAVLSRELLDIVDTSRYDDDTFDAVVAFGGPLSYAFEYDATALSGLFRIVKPGGVVVASVMSLLGSWRYFLGAVVGDMNTAGDEQTNRVFSTGDIRHIESEHICQMYRGSDIERLVANCRGTLLAMSASNWASLGDVAALNELESSSERWRVFLEQEIQSCAEPGAVDGGTHLLFAARPLAS